MRINDLTGMVFGRLTVLGMAGVQSGKSMWLCRCECGIEKPVRGTHLSGGSIVSCGCFIRQKCGNQFQKHGKSKTRTYRIWRNMINRCHWDKWPEWQYWGGRGIAVCERWRHSFDNFYADMGEAPPELSIDRINNDFGYEPGNCRWTTAKQQANNRRTSHKDTK